MRTATNPAMEILRAPGMAFMAFGNVAGMRCIFATVFLACLIFISGIEAPTSIIGYSVCALMLPVITILEIRFRKRCNVIHAYHQALGALIISEDMSLDAFIDATQVVAIRVDISKKTDQCYGLHAVGAMRLREIKRSHFPKNES